MIKNEITNPVLPEWVINEMIAYLYSNGMVLRNKDHTGVVHVPIVVYPSFVFYLLDFSLIGSEKPFR